MKAAEFKITPYTAANRPEVLRLLLALHSTFFLENAPQKIRELQEEKVVEKSYAAYLATIEKSKEDSWKILIAKTRANQIGGFIIGSISEDEHLVLSRIGKIEDWFVEPQYRKAEIGTNLYMHLEKWFREKGCHQVHSDTWHGNNPSISAHRKLGFLVSGITFGKKL
jgi:L-amino acid N-acyltransferase YncA